MTSPKTINPILILFSILTILIFLFPNQNSYATGNHNRDRVRWCKPAGDPIANPAEEVSVEPFGDILSDDLEVEGGNYYCAAEIMAIYVTFKVLIANMNAHCNSGDVIPRPMPSPLQDSIDIAKAMKNNATNTTPQCTASLTAVGLEFAAIMTILDVTHKIADVAFDYARICGSNWMQHNASTMLKDQPGEYQRHLDEWIHDPDNLDKLNMDYKEYREWYNGGVEREYSGCFDPNRAKDNGAYPSQRYYFLGTQPGIYNCENYRILETDSWDDPLETGPLSPTRISEYREAYDCCLNKSRNSICIEYNNDAVKSKVVSSITFGISDSEDVGAGDDGYLYKFCEGGGKRCKIGDLEFQADSLYNDTMICAATYSLCPYNFNVGGGTTKCNYFEDGINGEMIDAQSVADEDCTNKSAIRNGDCSFNARAGKCTNFCQMLEHCVIVDGNNYAYSTDISSPYFSTACLNFIGDSKNSRGFDTGMIGGGGQNHFSAPIAQCVRETIENVFYNTAGHTKCLNSLEIPDSQGNCYTPQYLYKKGDQVANGNFFAKIQDELRTIVQLVLILSITFTGVKILSGHANTYRRKEILGYIVKIALISYFVTGQGWQSGFFNGIYKASEVASTVVFKITVSDDEEKRDGCQFGEMIDESDIAYSSTSAYPEGKEYLAIWDTMDCKIARYLGMSGVDLDTATIAKLIFASIFTGTIGIYFAVFLAFFGILLIIATIQMLHIFLSSAISIIILIYVSLITIPTILFEKTKDIFNNWLTNLISLSVQPIMLFAYIGIYVSIFDNILIGSAKFYGTAPIKDINCESRCYDISGSEIPLESGQTAEDVCDLTQNETLVSPETDSVACIIDSKNSSMIGSWPGFELIGIGIPVLKSIFTNDGRKKLEKQLLTILKAMLTLYILSAFIGQIPSIAESITGGTSIKINQLDAAAAMKKMAGGMNAVAKRMRRGGKKQAKSMEGKL